MDYWNSESGGAGGARSCRFVSNGIYLAQNPETYSAVINLANLDPKVIQRVTVEVWDWSCYVNPVK